MMKSRVVRAVVLPSAALVFVLGGCGSDSVPEAHEGNAPAVAVAVDEKPSGSINDLGTWNAHYDAKRNKLSFTPLKAKGALRAGIKPQNFGEQDETLLELTTTESVVYQANDRCPGNADPTQGYYGGATAPTMSDGLTCDDGRLCALVTLKDLSTATSTTASKSFSNIFVEASNFVPSTFGGAEPREHFAGNQASFWQLSDAGGLWRYPGTLHSGETTAALRWNLSLPSCEDFDFQVRVKATAQTPSYAVTTSALDAADDSFLDACGMGGFPTMWSVGPNTYTLQNNIVPFAFAIYGESVTNSVKVYSDGALGFYDSGNQTTLPGTNAPLPVSSQLPLLLPFWDSLRTSSSGICWATTGTAPNRKWVVTWQSADVQQLNPDGNTEDMTFSIVLHETTGVIEYQYKSWLAGGCDVTSFTSRGASATIGLQGSSSTNLYTQVAYNAAYLPISNCTDYPNGYHITFTPSWSLPSTSNCPDPNDPTTCVNCAVAQECPAWPYYCSPDTNRCVDACKDGYQSIDEGDVDCGGACARKCQVGQHCWVDWDCASSYCLNDVCQ
jgi:hypothetical protein